MSTETLVISIVMAVFFGVIIVSFLTVMILDHMFWPFFLFVNALASIGTFCNTTYNLDISLWTVFSVIALAAYLVLGKDIEE